MARALAWSAANCAAAAATSSFPVRLLHPRAGSLGAGVWPDGISPHHGLAMLLLLALRSLLPLMFCAFVSTGRPVDSSAAA
jgi:hypothetical protein